MANSHHENQNHGSEDNHDDQEQKMAGHGGHVEMFRRKFWLSSLLSIPVLVFSETVQGWLGYSIPEFPLSGWIVPVFSLIVFYIGGLPFFRMARGELKGKQPGMMTLISMALAVAFLYSAASTIFNLESTFYWELVTLIDVMLLGHWIEMRSVQQASGALQELSKLLPDSANLVTEEDE
ncbi:MAG: heavy metal translocating P-type ATPase, partial [Brevefilum sp.]